VSQARAVITQGGQQLGAFTAATATGDPRLDIWYVVELTLDVAGTARLTPVQQFVSGNETTILSIPAGGGKASSSDPRPLSRLSDSGRCVTAPASL
jgi:hypothetical protein